MFPLLEYSTSPRDIPSLLSYISSMTDLLVPISTPVQQESTSLLSCEICLHVFLRADRDFWSREIGTLHPLSPIDNEVYGYLVKLNELD